MIDWLYPEGIKHQKPGMQFQDIQNPPAQPRQGLNVHESQAIGGNKYIMEFSINFRFNPYSVRIYSVLTPVPIASVLNYGIVLLIGKTTFNTCWLNLSHTYRLSGKRKAP